MVNASDLNFGENMEKSLFPQNQLDLDAVLLKIKNEYVPAISNLGVEDVALHVEEDFLRAINDYVFNVAFCGSFDDHHAKFNSLPIGYQRIYALEGILRHVHISGLNLYFDSPYGIFAADAHAACVAIGAIELAKIIERAILAYQRQINSPEWIQADPDTRQSSSPDLDEIDTEFWDCSDDIQALQIAYIQANRHHFDKTP